MGRGGTQGIEPWSLQLFKVEHLPIDYTREQVSPTHGIEPRSAAGQAISHSTIEPTIIVSREDGVKSWR